MYFLFSGSRNATAGPKCNNGKVYKLCTKDLCLGSSGVCPRSPRARCLMPVGGCNDTVCQRPAFFDIKGKPVTCECETLGLGKYVAISCRNLHTVSLFSVAC